MSQEGAMPPTLSGARSTTTSIGGNSIGATRPRNRTLTRSQTLARQKNDLRAHANRKMEVGRLAFEDAKYHFTQAEKLELFVDKGGQGQSELLHKLDLYFGILICLNMLILGIETDHGGAFPPGPQSPFWWTESVILALFLCEFYCRLRIEPFPRVRTIYATSLPPEVNFEENNARFRGGGLGGNDSDEDVDDDDESADDSDSERAKSGAPAIISRKDGQKEDDKATSEQNDSAAISANVEDGRSVGTKAVPPPITIPDCGPAEGISEMKLIDLQIEVAQLESTSTCVESTPAVDSLNADKRDGDDKCNKGESGKAIEGASNRREKAAKRKARKEEKRKEKIKRILAKGGDDDDDDDPLQAHPSMTPLEVLMMRQNAAGLDVGDEPDSENNFTATDVIKIESEGCCMGILEWFILYFQTRQWVQITWLGLDFIVIVASAIDVWGVQLMSGDDFGNVSALRVLRLLRVLRSIKLIRYFRDLWLLVHGLGRALCSIFWVMMLLGLVIYVCALFLTSQVQNNDFYLVGPDGTGPPHPDPRYENVRQYFSTVLHSMMTLFQIVTLENWPDIVRTMMEEQEAYGLFFALFIVTTNFMMMSLFIGVLVDNLTSATETADLQLIQQIRDQQESLRDELTEVFFLCDADGSGQVSLAEFKETMMIDEQMRHKVLKNLNMSTEGEIETLFETLDGDGDGILEKDEFVDGILKTRESEVGCLMLQMQNRILRELKHALNHGLSKSKALKKSKAPEDRQESSDLDMAGRKMKKGAWGKQQKQQLWRGSKQLSLFDLDAHANSSPKPMFYSADSAWTAKKTCAVCGRGDETGDNQSESRGPGGGGAKNKSKNMMRADNFAAAEGEANQGIMLEERLAHMSNLPSNYSSTTAATATAASVCVQANKKGNKTQPRNEGGPAIAGLASGGPPRSEGLLAADGTSSSRSKTTSTIAAFDTLTSSPSVMNLSGATASTSSPVPLEKVLEQTSATGTSNSNSSAAGQNSYLREELAARAAPGSTQANEQNSHVARPPTSGSGASSGSVFSTFRGLSSLFGGGGSTAGAICSVEQTADAAASNLIPCAGAPNQTYVGASSAPVSSLPATFHFASRPGDEEDPMSFNVNSAEAEHHAAAYSRSLSSTSSQSTSNVPSHAVSRCATPENGLVGIEETGDDEAASSSSAAAANPVPGWPWSSSASEASASPAVRASTRESSFSSSSCLLTGAAPGYAGNSPNSSSNMLAVAAGPSRMSDGGVVIRNASGQETVLTPADVYNIVLAAMQGQQDARGGAIPPQTSDHSRSC
ncbi:unnamed protein product [Amoebophrya sp. A25]|nr:unnamed protein product [Amoebophrya sp. A25]|eukprot:GSA25T00019671001.1